MVGQRHDHDRRHVQWRLEGDGAHDLYRVGLSTSGRPTDTDTALADAPREANDRFSGLGWPPELGTPSSTGSQNSVRYAVFPVFRRLAIEREAGVELFRRFPVAWQRGTAVILRPDRDYACRKPAQGEARRCRPSIGFGNFLMTRLSFTASEVSAGCGGQMHDEACRCLAEFDVV